MIAVIADDFTGAAEIGGVGLRYGLKVVIKTSVDDPEEADLMIMATDTRSMTAEEAFREVEKVTSWILKLKPDFIFKKLDSALRGNIACEIKSQLGVMGKKKAILVPGNPGLGRIIKNGHYFINGTPLYKTFFANSPYFPRNSSSVVEIIGRNDIPVVSRAVDDELPGEGVIVGDVTSQSDLSAWAQKIDDSCLAAGGAGFFNVILAGNYPLRKKISRETYCLNGKSLFVLGSQYPKNESMINKINGDGVSKMNMPEEIYRDRDFDPALLDRWANEIIRQIDLKDKVIISIDHEKNDESGLSSHIKMNIGLLIRKIIDRTDIRHLLIEGGATTHEILKNLNISRLYPFRELGLGIIQMRVDDYPDLCIITKPGSYSWPENVEFKNNEMGKESLDCK